MYLVHMIHFDLSQLTEIKLFPWCISHSFAVNHIIHCLGKEKFPH